MAELLLPKQIAWVRFPSPAPAFQRIAQAAIALLVTTLGAHAWGQSPNSNPNSSSKPVVGVLQPKQVPFTEAQLRQLTLPAGFEISVFAKNLGNVRWLQVAQNGDVYASRRAQGDVVLLRDTKGNGVADVEKTVARVPLAHGLLLHQGQLYIASDRALYRSDVQPDGSLSEPKQLLDDLPRGGNHPRRTLGMGPDGWLYLSVGSTCNNCVEVNPENATLLRLRPDGTQREIFARGLRNTMGFGWHPTTGQLYGFDHGSDMRGDDQPPEELNAIAQGKHYGWPWCLGARAVDPVQEQSPPGTTKEAFCPTTEAPAATYAAHSAPIGFLFYTGKQFPKAYQGDGFVAMRGSWNRAQPSGYRVLRVRFGADGKPTGMEDFVTGWLQNTSPPTQFGRVSGLAVAADGSLLIAEDQNGVIYRVRYTGAARE